MSDPNSTIDTTASINAPALADDSQASMVRRGLLLRADKAMSSTDVDLFLHSVFCGRTATVDPEGYPYVLPNLFVWSNGQVYQHTARRPGHFLANIRHSDRVCFEVDAPGEVFPYGHVECDTSVAYTSVVLSGRIRVVDDENEKLRFFEGFMHKYAPADTWGRERGSFPRIDSTIVYAITPETITGKHGQLPSIGEQWPQQNMTLSPEWRPRVILPQ